MVIFMTTQNEETKGGKLSTKISTPKKTHRDCKITIIIFVILTIIIILFALISKYTNWLPSEGTLVISIDNFLDENVSYELYIDADPFQSGIIEPNHEIEFETILKEGQYTIAFNVIGNDFDYLIFEEAKIFTGETTRIPFHIWEYHIPH